MNPEHRARTLRRAAVFLFALVLAPAMAGAQTAPVTLSLEEAKGLARRNNPGFLTAEARTASADWAVREAYGQLLPGANVSTSLSWQDAGTQRIGIFDASDFGLTTSTDYYSSSYSIGLSYRLSGSTLLAPGREKAGRRAVEANVDLQGRALDANTTLAYLAVRRARDGVTLAEQELQRTNDNLALAEARVAVGAAIPLDAKQAQVDRGRAEVALLQAKNLVQTEFLRLSELVGVRIEPVVELTTAFEVGEVPWDVASLLEIAREANPEIRAALATTQASDASVRMARTAYLPSLSLSAGFSGFTREAGNDAFLVQQAQGQAASQRSSCEQLNAISAGLSNPLPSRPADCSAFVLTADQEAQIRQGNSVFPFDFSREPLSLSLTLSLPVFQGFTRERQIEDAKVQARTAEYDLRAAELRTRTNVETNYLNLATARQTVDLEARNRELADDQLRLARERYRVGAATFIELQDAETVKARADRAYLNAVYSFFESLANLEAVVGRPLRNPGS